MTTNEKLPGLSAQRLVDEFGHDYVRLDFARTDGREPGMLVAEMSILNSSGDLKSLLANRGYDLDPTLPKLGDEIRRRIPAGLHRLVTRTGWTGSSPNLAFAFPDAMIGGDIHQVVLLPEIRERCLAGPVKGKLKDWRNKVALPALSSPVAALLIMAALTPPLFRFRELPESFILNVAGNSSSGKTTATISAASVWGDPERRRTWSGTDRGLVELAAANNGLLLVLDDAEQAATTPTKRLQRVHELTHQLTSGQGKEYSTAVASDQLPKLRFECVVLSSSPTTIEAAMGSNGRTDGDRARLLELQVPPGEDGGIFANPLTGATPNNSKDLADKLATASRAHFGKAGRKWIAFLVKNQSTLEARVASLSTEFSIWASLGATGVEARILSKFSLIYAAGVLAKEAGILPWSELAIKKITHRGFRDAMSTAFGKRFDPDDALVHLRTLLQSSRFKRPKKALSELKSGDRDGYVFNDRLYLKLEKFRHLLGEGQPTTLPTNTDIQRLLARLDGCGVVERASNGDVTKDVRIASKTNTKWLVLKLTELSAEIASTRQRLAEQRRLRPVPNTQE